MSDNPDKTKLYTWIVETVIPVTDPEGKGRSYNSNRNYQVIAKSAEDAMRAVRERHPGVRFIKIMTDRWIHNVLIAEES